MGWRLRWFGARAPRSQPFILLYGRPGCHLCDDALALLRSRQPRFGLRIEERNVEDDPDWESKFGKCVPVVFVDGKLRFRGRVEPALLDRLLRAAPADSDQAP